MAASTFERERRLSGMVAPSDETDEAPSKVIGRDKDTAVAMSRHYIAAVAPYVDPIYVERKIVVEPKDVDVTVTGIIDLGSREDDGGEAVRDIKTGERPPHERAAHDSDQLTMYALLRRAETGKIPERVALDTIVRPRKNFSSPYRVSQLSTRTSGDLEVMVARLNNGIEAVRRGVFVANGVGQWYCSPKWCRYHSTCRFVRHS